MNKDNYTKEVPMKEVKITDPFWSRYRELVRTKMIPYQWEALNDRVPDAEPSHCIRNFKIAARIEKGEFNGFEFQDSDLAKWLEAAAYSLVWYPDKELENTMDEAIDLIAKAQQLDGYLDTYYIINGLENRWTNLRDNHELYCAGHMLEAAVAYYHATGKRKLLNVMIRFIDHIDQVFGMEEGKIKGYPGHEELELALIKLYHITNDPKHLKLAKYFIDQRGQSPNYFEQEEKEHNREKSWKDSYFQKQYYQAAIPVRDQVKAQGHAVRAVYLYTGMADVAKETEDEELYEACKRLWSNLIHKRMYITGAIGSSSYGESFTYDYDLPSDTVYGETCASIGLIFFAHRMLQLNPKGEYADVIERELYNGTISGMSLDGTKFFYVNPLEVVPESCEKDHSRSHVKPERQKWFGCACCPTNLARLITSLSTYIYTEKKSNLYIHQYIGNTSTVEWNGVKTEINMDSDYLHKGKVRIELMPSSTVEGTLAVRIPGWCNSFTINRNNIIFKSTEVKCIDGYVHLNGAWSRGDVIELTFELPVRVIQANPRVRENIGKVAIMRGPVVYCMEQEDNGEYLQRIFLPKKPEFDVTFEKDLLGGIVKLTCEAKVVTDEDWDENTLYRDEEAIIYSSKTVTWVPYYSWGNRKCGEMLVWVRKE